jgi:hypothetical protein
MKLKKYDIAYEDVQSHELELNMILPQVVSENRAWSLVVIKQELCKQFLCPVKESSA